MVNLYIYRKAISKGKTLGGEVIEMTVTVRKCDFCGQEISPKIRSCKTVIIFKSHEDCIDPLPDATFDICHDCILKASKCLSGEPVPKVVR